MKLMSRSYIWWPNYTKDIEQLAKNCFECNKIRNDPSKVTLHPWEKTTEPFQRVHVDYAGPFYNTYLLILIDAYSRWPEIYITKDMTTATTIQICRRIFSQFGLPKVLVSDSGRQFTAHEFRNFMKENGIFHKFSPSYHPATNGMAERYVRTVKQSLRALHWQGTNEEKDIMLCKFLLQYRITPHSVTNKPPATLFLNRNNLRTRLDLLKPAIEHVKQEAMSEQGIRNFAEGERVAVRDYIHEDKWKFGRVVQKLGKLIYTIRLDDGKIRRKHIDQIRKIGENIASDQLLQPEPLTQRSQKCECDIPRLLDRDQVSESGTESVADERPTERNTEDRPKNRELETVPPNVITAPEIALDKDLEAKAEIPKTVELRRSKRTRKAPEKLDL
ncbi:uncharacterized protein K02A2.6-like [Temnothorax curvispinosus]|uniref:Uncharacterized protein K02A2.6-like n=1 Tax=Temnothorax curvispinosus TaxID=300111 RepID=A0A6J1QZ85_9HYME|nr:uncharacterized protein K02A2.6-like [Temnothorax curvispinosus]XP_024887652.1 uncharacterized protein K02A2.6-like [Temnothorax curvispinosus]